MNKINFYTSTVTLLTVLVCATAACRDEDGTLDGTKSGRELTFGSLNTRAGDTNTDFEDKATLRTYLSCEGGKTQETTLTCHKENGKEASWTSNPLLYWQSSTRTHTLTVYQDAGALEEKKEGKRTFSLTSITNAEGWKKQDIVGKSVSVTATNDPLSSIELGHCMAMVKVTLSSSIGLDMNTATISVKMKLPTKGEFDLATGTVKKQANSSETGEITFYRPDGNKPEYYALALPGQTGTKEITITVNGGNYVYTATNNIELTAGACSTYALTLNPGEVEALQTSVEEWQEVSAQGVINSLLLKATSGNLTNELKNLTDEQKKIKRIIVTGTLDTNNGDSKDGAALATYIKTNNITDLSLLIENTNITRFTFKECTSLQKVVLGEAITDIGNGKGFQGCTALTTISMPGIGSIWGGFEGCTSLKNIDSPKAVYIGGGTFKNCTALTSITMPKVVKIEGHGFEGCTALTSINMPQLTEIWDEVFKDCRNLQTKVDLPELTTLGASAFSGCTNLETVILPKVTSVGASAFQGDKNIKTMTLGITNVNQLNQNWNMQSTIGELKLPNAEGILTKQYMYQNTGNSQYNQNNGYIEKLNAPKLSAISDEVFQYYTTLTTVTATAATSIGSYAFNGCTALTTVTATAATSIGSYAFNGCTALTTVTVPNATSIGDHVFTKWEFDFYANNKQALTSVGTNAFAGSKLTYFLYTGTSMQGERHCTGCKSLKTADLRNLTTSISHRVFHECSNLETAILTGNVYGFGDLTFSGINSLNFVWGILPDQDSFSWGYSFRTFSGTTITNLFLTKITTSEKALALKNLLLTTGDNKPNCFAVTNVYYNYNGLSKEDPAKATNAELTNTANYTKLTP